jgi:tRNA (adenine22-N1)-methyltransferase
MYLSIRLQLVYDHLVPDEDVWDFCCDHGYLGGAAYKSRCFKDVYFVDPVSSIMDNLKNRFQTFVYSADNKSTAHFLVQKGETVTQAVEGNVCIVGVGGVMICDILKSLASNDLLKAKRLILGPHRDPEKIVELIANDALFKKYKLIKQKDVMENGRKREFFIFDAL